MKKWQKQVDQYIERKSRPEKEKDRKRREKQEKKDAARLKRNMAKLRKKPCVVCGLISPEPTVHVNIRGSVEFYGSPEIERVVDWDWPEGFERCDFCRRRVCPDCIYRGMCKICASGWIERFLGELTRCFRR